ncbi:MAG: hypothetical protein WED07_15815 [Candidatus Freyarchaeum deiterrae]
MSRWDPIANVLLCGSLLSALDKIGIKPTLIGRQTARVLAPMIKDIAQKYAEAEQPAKTMDQFIIDFKTALKHLNVFDRESFEMNYSKGVLSMKVTDCMWLDMLNFGKSQGYKTCAFCGAGIFTTALISTLDLGEVSDIKVENKEKVCNLKLAISEQ